MYYYQQLSKYFSLLVCLLVTTLLVAGCGEANSTANALAPAAVATAQATVVATDTPPATPTRFITWRPADTVGPAIASPTPSPYVERDAGKQAMYAQETVDKSRAPKIPPTFVPATATAIALYLANPPTPRPLPTPEPGIRSVGTPPNLKRNFIAHNAWIGKLNGVQYAVFAGGFWSAPENPNDVSNGVIFVQKGGYDSIGAGNDKIRTDQYLTPQKDGSVTIIEENNYRLTLLSFKGTKFTFDLVSRTFV